jgi:hypothetical protein
MYNDPTGLSGGYEPGNSSTYDISGGGYTNDPSNSGSYDGGYSVRACDEDGLHGIASREGGTTKDWIKANPQLNNPNVIHPGDTLNYPDSVYKRNDGTGSEGDVNYDTGMNDSDINSIAKKYGADPKLVQNELDKGNKVKVETDQNVLPFRSIPLPAGDIRISYVNGETFNNNANRGAKITNGVINPFGEMSYGPFSFTYYINMVDITFSGGKNSATATFRIGDRMNFFGLLEYNQIDIIFKGRTNADNFYSGPNVTFAIDIPRMYSWSLITAGVALAPYITIPALIGFAK